VNNLERNPDLVYEAIERGVYKAFIEAFSADYKKNNRTIGMAIEAGVDSAMPDMESVLRAIGQSVDNAMPYPSQVLDAIYGATEAAQK